MVTAAPAITPADLLSPVAGVILLAAAFHRRRPGLSVAAVVVVVVVPLAWPWGGVREVDALTLTVLDVGQGDAVLVEVPAQPGRAPSRLLVDGGPDQRLALRLLRDRGIRYLDAVAVSHPHADHTDGLPAVVAGIGVGTLLVGPRLPAELDDPAVSATAVEVLASQRDVPTVRVGAGQWFRLGAATVDVLSPPNDGSLGREPNENSLVLRVRHGGDTILLTGDAEEAAQLRLLQRPDLLAADILKVPHHGGNTNAAGFIAAVGAQTAVIGVGSGNDYGHPHPDVLADLDGVRVLRTDVEGTVSMTVE